MNILDLIVKLIQLYGEHGNLNVKVDSYGLERIDHVNAIPGEHGAYIDLRSEP